MPRQSVDLADVPGPAERFGVKVIRGKVIAAGNDQPTQVAVVPRHAVQRFYSAHHRHVGDERIGRVHEQFRPRPIDRECFDGPSVPGKLAVLHHSPRLQPVNGVAIGNLVQRNRQLQLVRADAERRARHRHPLRIAGELKLGLRGLERAEMDVPVAEDVYPPVLHAPVHPAGHLEKLVGAQVHAR